MATVLVKADLLCERQEITEGQNVPSIRPAHQEDKPNKNRILKLPNHEQIASGSQNDLTN